MPLRPDTDVKLQAIFREVLQRGEEASVRECTQSAEDAWDSLAHTLLVAAIESEFGLEIDTADSMELTSFEAFARYLEERGQ